MAIVVALADRLSQDAHAARARKPVEAQILLFTGVRYERLAKLEAFRPRIALRGQRNREIASSSRSRHTSSQPASARKFLAAASKLAWGANVLSDRIALRTRAFPPEWSSADPAATPCEAPSAGSALPIKTSSAPPTDVLSFMLKTSFDASS